MAGQLQWMKLARSDWFSKQKQNRFMKPGRKLFPAGLFDSCTDRLEQIML